MADSPGVIILGCEYQALGLLRQLSRCNIRCVMVDQDAWGVARFSRHRCRFHRAPAYESAPFWPWLAQLALRHGYVGWIPIATDDEQVRQLAEHFDEVQQVFRYAGLPWATYQKVYNKRLAHGWVEALGVPTPRTYIPDERSDLPGAGWEFPLIIKPAVKREYRHHTLKKAISVASRAELQSVLAGELRAVSHEDLMYQEIIPGDGTTQWSYAGLFAAGRPLAAYTACRRRQHPPDFGRASTYVIARHDPEVEAQSRRLLAELGYTGLAEVEWKRDLRDGRLKFLEINARCWGWHSLSSRVVGNLPQMLYEHLVRGRADLVEPRYGHRWVKWITDVPVAAALIRQGELTWRDYLASVRGSVVHCDWDWLDPLPFALQFALLPYLFVKRGY